MKSWISLYIILVIQFCIPSVCSAYDDNAALDSLKKQIYDDAKVLDFTIPGEIFFFKGQKDKHLRYLSVKFDDCNSLLSYESSMKSGECSMSLSNDKTIKSPDGINWIKTALDYEPADSLFLAKNLTLVGAFAGFAVFDEKGAITNLAVADYFFMIDTPNAVPQGISQKLKLGCFIEYLISGKIFELISTFSPSDTEEPADKAFWGEHGKISINPSFIHNLKAPAWIISFDNGVESKSYALEIEEPRLQKYEAKGPQGFLEAKAELSQYSKETAGYYSDVILDVDDIDPDEENEQKPGYHVLYLSKERDLIPVPIRQVNGELNLSQTDICAALINLCYIFRRELNEIK